MKVLGIDGSLRCTGLGLVEGTTTQARAVMFDTVKMSSKASHSACLAAIRERMDAALAGYAPEAAAVEGGFFAKNVKVAMVLGEVRGVVIASCAAAGVPVFEYTPRMAKQQVTGWGAAPKEQVAKMVMARLGLRERPPEDAADALALALCHLSLGRGITAPQPL